MDFFPLNPQESELIIKKVRQLKNTCLKTAQKALVYVKTHIYFNRSRTEATLKRAKRVASENVLVLGFTEDLPAFMEVLEFVLPSYFAGAFKVFSQICKELVHYLSICFF